MRHMFTHSQTASDLRRPDDANRRPESEEEEDSCCIPADSTMTPGIVARACWFNGFEAQQSEIDCHSNSCCATTPISVS